MRKDLNRGFTLIELMVVVAIVAILASIAYPSYVEAVRKGRRAEARSALTSLMQQQERYMTQNNTYLAFTNTDGVTEPASVPFKTYSGDSAAGSAYYLSASVCTGTTINECVAVSAEPIQSDPVAGTLTMSSTGAKSCDGSNQSVCWK